MPWYSKGKCVYKKSDNKKVGCTKGSVKKYLAALHINAHEDAPRKKMKSFKDFWEDTTNPTGLTVSADPASMQDPAGDMTAEGAYAQGQDEVPSPGGYDEYEGQDGPPAPLTNEAKKKSKNKVLDKAIKYLTKFMDHPMPAEGEEDFEGFLKDLDKMAKELQNVEVEPVDVLAAIKEPHMAMQYLIRGPSIKGNAGKGALEDLKDLRSFNLLEDEDVPGDNPDVNASVSQGLEGENFMDGKHPGRKGLAKRSGVNTKASVSTLRSVAKHSSGEKARMAHWLANMKAGKAKHHK
jgi:hypothetical protein